MDIHSVNSDIAKNKGKKRVGRGTGSGRGKTSCRGCNGQGSRAGFSMSPVFEGGQMPLARRIPKRGFNNKRFADVFESVTIFDINIRFEDAAEINPETLQAKGLIEGRGYVKIIGNDEPKNAYRVKVHAISKGAKSALEQAGGTIELLPKKQPVVKNKMKSIEKKAE